MAAALTIGVQQEHEQKWITAIHEAGHVLGDRLMGRKIKEATIVPTNRFGGHVTTQSGDYRYDYEGTILCSLLGHAAEVEFGYRREFGHGIDYAEVEKMLKDDIKEKKSKAWSVHTGKWDRGFNHTTKEEYTTTFCKWSKPQGGYYDAKGKYVSYRKVWMKATRVMKSEWKPEFDRFVRKARRIAKKHRAYIEMVARLLVEKNTLTDAEIPQLQDV